MRMYNYNDRRGNDGRVMMTSKQMDKMADRYDKEVRKIVGNESYGTFRTQTSNRSVTTYNASPGTSGFTGGNSVAPNANTRQNTGTSTRNTTTNPGCRCIRRGQAIYRERAPLRLSFPLQGRAQEGSARCRGRASRRMRSASPCLSGILMAQRAAAPFLRGLRERCSRSGRSFRCIRSRIQELSCCGAVSRALRTSRQIPPVPFPP